MENEYFERFWSKVEVTGFCWNWLAYKQPLGYGIFKLNYKAEYAHRVAYQLLVGEIPRDKVLDHVCMNASCVNPDHLEVVTQGENVARAKRGGAFDQRRKTHCPQGHEYTEENTYRYPVTNKRGCRECMRSHARRYYRQNKGGLSSVD